MIQKIKASKSEKIIFIFIIILALFSHGQNNFYVPEVIAI